jgi:hypothetical protein
MKHAKAHKHSHRDANLRNQFEQVQCGLQAYFSLYSVNGKKIFIETKYEAAVSVDKYLPLLDKNDFRYSELFAKYV